MIIDNLGSWEQSLLLTLEHPMTLSWGEHCMMTDKRLYYHIRVIAVIGMG